MQADRWLAEGADSLTVRPSMTCVDIVTRLREYTRVPLIAYSRPGNAALAALSDAAMVEYHAGLILSFAAERVARAL